MNDKFRRQSGKVKGFAEVENAKFRKAGRGVADPGSRPSSDDYLFLRT